MAWVELEWNPFSTASSAARAERDGRVGEALRLYDRAGQYDRAIECLRLSLPDWPIREPLIALAAELLELKRHASRLGALADDAHEASEHVWATADRLAMVAALKGPASHASASLTRLPEHTKQALVALRAARNEHADLVLRGGSGSPADIQKRFQALAEAAREL